MLTLLVAIYQLVGVYMAALGPLRHSISRLVGTVSYAYSLREYFKQGPAKWFMALPEALVVRVSAVGIVAGVILGWPGFLPRLYADWKESRAETCAMADGVHHEPTPLKFSRTSGCGEIYCRDCHHREEIVSFLHGFGDNAWSVTGYQCESCHRFCQIERREQDMPDLVCPCGGKLSRDHIIVCPRCDSERTRYIDSGVMT